jgi:hypothetical protein
MVDRAAHNAQLPTVEFPMSDKVSMQMVSAVFSQHMCQKLGAVVIDKENSTIMQGAAIGFDVGRLFGLSGLPDGAYFNAHFATTLGPMIFMPKAIRNGDPLAYMSLLTHELEHVAQWKAEKIGMPWLYLTEPSMRASYEAQAFGGQLDLEYWFTGRLPTDLTHQLNSLASSYHLRPEDVKQAEAFMLSHLDTIKAGGHVSRSSLEAIVWLERNYPQLKGSF